MVAWVTAKPGEMPTDINQIKQAAAFHILRDHVTTFHCIPWCVPVRSPPGHAFGQCLREVPKETHEQAVLLEELWLRK